MPIDCVVIVHRVGVAQIEGEIAMGLSEALYGDIRIEAGRVLSPRRRESMCA
jgi:CO/xanthine dehydrogenase Mo-binding subunit